MKMKILIIALTFVLMLPATATSQSPASGTIDGYEYVDLGLSVLWATCNIGADKPEDYGDYYAWGESETKSTYTESNSATYGKTFYTFLDAASAHWGLAWRIPTADECQELIDSCTWSWITVGGHNGCKVTSKKNGNSIFLPAAGGRYDTHSDLTDVSGCYNSSSPGDYDNACVLGFHSGDHDVCWSMRCRGLPIRPVTE